VIKRVEAGLDSFEPPPVKPDTVADVIETYCKRHVESRRLRSGDEIRRICARYVLPYWSDRPFAEIRRSDVAKLLDHIEDRHGPWVADHVLARVLNDDELRAVWHAAGNAGTFGAFVRVLLLTGQRREKVVTIRWDDIAPDGTWTIATAAREKGNAGTLRLPVPARAIIDALPRIVGNPHVFAGQRDGQSINNFARSKAALDKASGVTGWVLHDLRRVSRSLMSRAGVSREHAERVLGHVQGGVEGIYNRHSYDAEKAAALRRLAALVERIVSPPSDKVLVLHEGAS
jgi:integrase